MLRKPAHALTALAWPTYRQVWDRARESAPTPAEYASTLARRAYDLRHACVLTWLSGGHGMNEDGG